MKLAICTGASSGIGENICKVLLDMGFNVIGVSRQRPKIDHENFQFYKRDLSKDGFNFSEIEKLQLSSLDHKEAWLINCAGVLGPVGKVKNTVQCQELEDSFRVNAIMPIALTGWFISKYEGLQLRVVQISSGAARKAYQGWMTYCSTKAALKMATEAMAQDYSENKNIKFFIYEPGVVDTPMQDQVRQLNAEVFPTIERFKSLKRNNELVRPEDSAKYLIDKIVNKDNKQLTEFRFSN